MDDANYLKPVDPVNVNICRLERSKLRTCGTPSRSFLSKSPDGLESLL